MAYAYLANLVDSFAIEGEGPDLDSLEGLLEHLRQPLPETEQHQDLTDRVKTFQARAEEARHSRQRLLLERQQQLNPELLALMNANLQGLEGLVQSLESLAGELQAGQATPEALNAVSQAAQIYRSNSQAILDLSCSQAPLCPRCGSAGAEAVCAECHLDRLLPEPLADLELQPGPLNSDFLAIYQGYIAVLEGQLAFSQLLPLLVQFEAELELASNDALEACQSEPEHPAHPLFLRVFQDALPAVRLMISVREHLQTRELHQGWANLATCALGLNEAYAKIHEYEGDEEEPIWSQDDFDEEILAHLDEES